VGEELGDDCLEYTISDLDARQPTPEYRGYHPWGMGLLITANALNYTSSV